MHLPEDFFDAARYTFYRGGRWKWRTEKRMEFTNLQFQGINMGVCGSFDVQFLKIAAVKWQELEDMIRGRGCRGTQDPPDVQLY